MVSPAYFLNLTRDGVEIQCGGVAAAMDVASLVVIDVEGQLSPDLAPRQAQLEHLLRHTEAKVFVGDMHYASMRLHGMPEVAGDGTVKARYRFVQATA